MSQHYLVATLLLTLLPGCAAMWMSSICNKDSDCPIHKCCNVVNVRTSVQVSAGAGSCVDRGHCQRSCNTNSDCRQEECCKISHVGAYRGTCTPRVTYRGVCLATSKIVAPLGQHFVCPCGRGLKCTGTGHMSGYGESGICKDVQHLAKCGHDGHCSGHRCCRYGHCVVPFGGARRHRCGAFRG
ncbi:uncharacterized protein LOC121367338 isoform X2 [Gigantopelta aegis]|uniref:uncharacterized protein LOC121367338 isoform X2 n=1 Tax=Gigantopelta aegis TaxID=1735272 RepID=UPI001B88BC7C|nr:uncharacterized protein LOC121367338 isoform X2 [Gigantopelta aegis]